MAIIHFKTDSIYYGLPLLSSLWLAGSKVKSVPDRLKALQKNWSAGTRDSNMAVLILCIVCLVIIGIACLVYWMKHLHSKRKEERKTLEIAKAAGLSEREYKLLLIIGSGNRGNQINRLLHSLSFFDEMTGAYLKKYCILRAKPGSVIAALETIRKKLHAALGESDVIQPGLREISLLSHLEIMNKTNQGSGICKGQLVERQSNRLRIVGLSKAAQSIWKEGDNLRIKSVDVQGLPVECLLNFRGVEARNSGLIMVEFEHASSPLLGGLTEKNTLRYHVRMSHPTGGIEKALLQWISPIGAHLKSTMHYPAGDEVTLLVDPERSRSTVQIPSTVIYCRHRSKEVYSIGIRFDSLPEEALKVIQDLGTNSGVGAGTSLRW